MIENRRRALGGAYFDAGMTRKARNWSDHRWTPIRPSVIGWIGWANCCLP